MTTLTFYDVTSFFLRNVSITFYKLEFCKCNIRTYAYIKDNNIKITIKAKIYGFFMLEGTRFSAV